jgi:laminin, alpha 1/2
MKSAISPRPASWILEKSTDGMTFSVWQYFGANDVDCQKRFNISGNNANYVFKTDSEVICSTQFSKLIPLENGEVKIKIEPAFFPIFFIFVLSGPHVTVQWAARCQQLV